MNNNKVLFKKNKRLIAFVIMPDVFMQRCIVCQIEYIKNRVKDCDLCSYFMLCFMFLSSM